MSDKKEDVKVEKAKFEKIGSWKAGYGTLSVTFFPEPKEGLSEYNVQYSEISNGKWLNRSIPVESLRSAIEAIEKHKLVS